MWYIIEPYHYIVWILLIAAMPIYLIVMGLTDYFYHGVIAWDDVGGLLIRNVLSEQNFRPQDRAKAYQKMLDFFWIWSMLVLVQAYSGNLTAMLAKPKLQQPIKTLAELTNQTQISWVIEKGLPAEFYLKTWANGTILKELYNRASLMPPLGPEELLKYGCYAAKLKDEGHFKMGSISDIGRILPMYNKDFTETGKCNFYLLEEKILESIFSMAFQVRNKFVLSKIIP